MALIASGAITVTDVSDGARNFLVQPIPPYQVGEVWTQDGVMRACIRTRTAVVPTRTNLHTDPRLTGWTVGAGTPTNLSTPTEFGRIYDNSGGTGQLRYDRSVALTQDTVYTVSVRFPRGTTSSIFNVWAPGFTPISGVQTGSDPDDPNRLWRRFTAPVTGSYPVGVGAVAGAIVEVEKVLVEESSVLNPWFDGSQKPVVRTNLNPIPYASSSTSTAPSTGVWQTGQTVSTGPIPTGENGSRATVTVPGTSTLYLPRNSFSGNFLASLRGRRVTIVTRMRLSAGPFSHSSISTVSNYRKIGDTADTTPPSGMMVAQSHPGTTVLPANEIITHWRTLDIPADALSFNASTFSRSSNLPAVGEWFDFLDCDVYEGDYDPNRTFLPAGTIDPDGLVVDWSGTPGNSPQIMTDPGLVPAWTGDVNASTSTLTWDFMLDWSTKIDSVTLELLAKQAQSTANTGLDQTSAVDDTANDAWDLANEAGGLAFSAHVTAEEALKLLEQLIPGMQQATDGAVTSISELAIALSGLNQDVTNSTQDLYKRLQIIESLTGGINLVLNDYSSTLTMPSDGLRMGDSTSPIRLRLDGSRLVIEAITSAGGRMELFAFDATALQAITNKLSVNQVFNVGDAYFRPEPSGGISITGT